MHSHTYTSANFWEEAKSGNLMLKVKCTDQNISLHMLVSEYIIQSWLQDFCVMSHLMSGNSIVGFSLQQRWQVKPIWHSASPVNLLSCVLKVDFSHPHQHQLNISISVLQWQLELFFSSNELPRKVILIHSDFTGEECVPWKLLPSSRLKFGCR